MRFINCCACRFSKAIFYSLGGRLVWRPRMIPARNDNATTKPTTRKTIRISPQPSVMVVCFLLIRMVNVFGLYHAMNWKLKIENWKCRMQNVRYDGISRWTSFIRTYQSKIKKRLCVLCVRCARWEVWSIKSEGWSWKYEVASACTVRDKKWMV